MPRDEVTLLVGCALNTKGKGRRLPNVPLKVIARGPANCICAAEMIYCNGGNRTASQPTETVGADEIMIF